MNIPVLRTLLIGLIVLGIIVPFAALIPFLIDHGLDVEHITQQAVANRISAFAWLDVIISAIVLLTVIFNAKIITRRQAFYVAGLTCFVGVSAGLPLFFYFMLSNKPIAKLLESPKQ